MEAGVFKEEVYLKESISIEDQVTKNESKVELHGPEDYLLDGTLRRPHMEWWRTVFLILGDILGTGILAIPSGMASMGWLLGTLFLVVMCGIFIYCGLLLYKMRLMFPHIRTYGDLGRQVYGKWGEWAVYLIQYTSLFLVLPVYLLVASTALRDTVSPNSCLIIWMFVNSGILILFMQTRTLRFMAWYSLVGTIAICVTLVIAIVQIIIDAFSSNTHGQLISSGGFENGLVGSGDIIFAYSGIYVFIEFMDEMKQPQDFSKAIYTANIFTFFRLHHRWNTWLRVKRIANGFLWLHVLVAFVVHALVFNRAVAVRFCKKYVDDFHLKGLLAWFTVTFVSTGLSLLLNIFFPYLSDIESLGGTLFSPITGFLYPNLFYWKCTGSTMSTKRKLFGWFILAVFGIGYTILGTYGTIYSMVQNVGASPLLYKCLSS
ncbi:amino acid transporter, AAAP family [Galdieria sulphuraria]|uniref:Amino acid transporter, AAAP family n=1 Tax=Galdieria sulphuraria TaxID=130081 RepID=M2XR07_GALSU|nr:amino acid transporter, AAAP family [Galdieria sulphuraria]EME26088.1 amino acid transporter, AAAP family [Galdieria sulphuraria]|eukprot:XP_005702608.1 amino acid transporter, AAAP family [Galdieria sulphuraria]